MSFSFHGKEVRVPGNRPEIGSKMPSFSVFDKNNNLVSLNSLLSDKPLLISVVPDIDTRVCSIQTKHFNQEVDNHNEINFVTISTNTIEQQNNWCAAENVQNMRMLSDKNQNFGKALSIFIPELNLDLRSVWVVNSEGVITYKEVLENQSDEPNYSMVLDHIDQMYTK
ncbi:thiol peroxidase [Companilactobacillus sp. DQM5]|uniref:thiol peroxidase n=1 Tax=Companilactobacillus sp. DQM5 TaxID=3463359 RepID=UPI00405851A1